MAKSSKKNWVQRVVKKIDKRGTEGSFTRKARAAGYKDTLKYAKVVKDQMDKKKKPLSKPDMRLLRQAVFAINVNK